MLQTRLCDCLDVAGAQWNLRGGTRTHNLLIVLSSSGQVCLLSHLTTIRPPLDQPAAAVQTTKTIKQSTPPCATPLFARPISVPHRTNLFCKNETRTTRCDASSTFQTEIEVQERSCVASADAKTRRPWANLHNPISCDRIGQTPVLR